MFINIPLTFLKGLNQASWTAFLLFGFEYISLHPEGFVSSNHDTWLYMDIHRFEVLS